MDCEKVRDWFSSFWEKELSPSEEKAFKEHLSSCLKCKKELEQFGKTMRWLHSTGEVEIPEGFLSGLDKKLEEKRRAAPGEKGGGRGLHFPMSFKLPAQAVAMVAVVFLVFYLTKMIPTERVRVKETKQTPSSLSMEEKPEGESTGSAIPPRPEPFDRLKAPSSIEGLGAKASPSTEGELERRRLGSTVSEPLPSVRQSHRPEQSPGTGREAEALTQKEVKDKRSALETTTETPRPRDVEQARADVPKERQSEGVPASKKKAEAKKSDALGTQAVDSKKAARASIPSLKPGELASQEKSLIASKPPQEIILRISDRKKVIPLLQDLVKQFGGEWVTSQEDLFLVSLPTGSFLEFKKELSEISSSSKTDLLVAKQQAAGSLSLEEKVKTEEGDKKSKGPAKLAAGTESRTIVRILLVEE